MFGFTYGLLYIFRGDKMTEKRDEGRVGSFVTLFRGDMRFRQAAYFMMTLLTSVPQRRIKIPLEGFTTLTPLRL